MEKSPQQQAKDCRGRPPDATYPLEKTTSKVSADLFPLSPLGVVVRFRSVFAEHVTRRPYGQQLLKVVLLLGQKKLGKRAVVVFWVVSTGNSLVDPQLRRLRPGEKGTLKMLELGVHAPSLGYGSLA